MNLSQNIRGMVLVLCLAFAEVLFALGWVSWRTGSEFSAIEANFYDNGVVATGYARDALSDFLRFEARRANAGTASPEVVGKPEIAGKAEIDKTVQHLDLAIAKAMSEGTRHSAKAVRANVVALTDSARPDPPLAEIDGALAQLVKQFTDDALAYRQRADEVIGHFDRWWRTLIAVSVMFSVLIVLCLRRAVLRPLNQATAIATAISDGKLNNVITASGRGETAQLLEALSRMQVSIRNNNKKMAADSAELVKANSQLHFALLALEKREAELQGHKDNLENTIAERTTELARNNKQLVKEVTEHRKTQRDLLTAKELAEEANVAKSQFLANMSHEIRTPMNAIIGMVDLLGQTQLMPRQAHFATVIKQSATALLKTINDVLDFSKIESGHLGLDIGSVDLLACAQEVQQMLAEVARKKGIELTCAVSDDVPKLVQGDGTRLRQVLVNLVGNGIKFTERGAVGIHVVPLDRSDGQVRVRIEVRDTGVGIPRDAIGSIFDAFRQVDGMMNRRVEGTGLGLSIVRQLIEIMGGRIEVDSEVGRGSVFRVEIPFPVLGAEAATPILRTAAFPGKRALIIDDSAELQQVVERHLWNMGLISTSVDTLEAGLDELSNGARSGQVYDLVLADGAILPLGGLDPVTWLRKAAAGEQLPVIVLSSSGQSVFSIGENSRHEVFSLNKPVTETELRDRVADALATDVVGYADVPAAGPAEVAEVPATHSELDLRVLVAEDHPVNQEIINEHLAAFGCRVDIVANGNEAIAAFNARNYDLILMDCQMPEVDGFEATRAIRQRESRNMDPNARRVSIIALTAHAMAGDRDRCIRAGMDDYLTKPFEVEELYRLIDRWKPRSAPAKTGAARPQIAALEPASRPETVLDMKVVQSLKRGFRATGPSLLKKVGRLYLEFTPKDLADMEAAIDTQDAAMVKSIAHKLKSASTNVGARGLASLFKDLEGYAMSKRLGDAHDTLRQIKIEFERAAAALQHEMTAA